MKVFTSIDSFRRGADGHRKWDRTVQALEDARRLPGDVMYSIGDSLTFVQTRRRYLGDSLVGHRRYQEIIHAADGPLRIAVGEQRRLISSEAYSDLSDREHFSPDGPIRCIDVPLGGVAVIGIDEASRVRDSDGVPVHVHVTVEGATFLNK